MITTPRLRLDFPTPAQIDSYYNAIIGTSIFDTLIWDGPARVDDLHEYWQARRADSELGPDHELSLAVIDRSTNVMIGSMSLRPFRGSGEVIDLGYAFASAFHGRGFATEAVGALIDHAFLERGMCRCFAGVFVGNTALRRVLEKLGFQLEGILRQSIKKRSVWRDEWMLALLEEEWRARRENASPLR